MTMAATPNNGIQPPAAARPRLMPDRYADLDMPARFRIGAVLLLAVTASIVGAQGPTASRLEFVRQSGSPSP